MNITARDIAIKIYKKLDGYIFNNKPKVEVFCPDDRIGVGSIRFTFDNKILEFGLLISNPLELRMKAQEAVDKYDEIISAWLAEIKN